jgi:hypothetical protein
MAPLFFAHLLPWISPSKEVNDALHACIHQLIDALR